VKRKPKSVNCSFTPLGILNTNNTTFNIFTRNLQPVKKKAEQPELEISFTACRQGNLLACGVKYQLRDYCTFLNQDQRKRRP
jgi:hypothetical protein